ncbi:CcdC family protein [Hazenella coriacea]|uniref:Membrane protein CcdC involved in cytochrome C biogenesis n=1 Tax=Hazenella coriacea TaxID=1179467 RepID=A0A4R3L6Y2_9BACL|nr:cytochrome c biogenesis protein CcdC [Hazenella coriacea]TCS94785.1 membrane protein CcdC involved in cytochrome C biogenesis [Hazenella coriacea]
MGQVIPYYIQILAPIVALIMATAVVVIRLRATKKPTSAKKILIPPLGMSTGFMMFVYPPTHIPWSWALIAFVAGIIFLAIPLIQTSKFEIIDNQIYLKRSKAFVVILIILLIIRMALHNYIEQHISIFQTAGIFFVLAFGMLLPWRLVMFYQYKQLKKELSNESIVPNK